MASFFKTLGSVRWGTVSTVVEQAGKLLSAMRRGKETSLPELPATSDLDQLRKELEAERAVIAALRAELTQATEIVLDLSRGQTILAAQMKQLQIWVWCIGGVAGVALLASVILLTLPR